ncbi:entericidin A/B family lipoprotein [Trichloromonas sp.]|nr:entericidin A/B family lipoprotein [Trichloromonas sp.]
MTRMMMMMMMLLLTTVLFLGGCETTKGVGKDMQKAGNWIEEKASK